MSITSGILTHWGFGILCFCLIFICAGIPFLRKYIVILISTIGAVLGFFLVLFFSDNNIAASIVTSILLFIGLYAVNHAGFQHIDDI